MMQRIPLVKLLTRPGCVTCDKAKFILQRIKANGVNFDGKVVNILKQRDYIGYNDELPVILVDEEPVCRLTVEESVLRKAIQEAALKV